MKLNDFFDQIFVINLDRRPDRELAMRQKMRDRNLEFERITAFDGSKILKDTRKTMSKGAWGYLFTWKNILELAIKRKLKSFLSFDDDVIFHRDFDAQINNVLDWIPSDSWKIIHLGASQHVQIPEPDDFFYHPGYTDGSFAVGVHSSVFHELLDEVDKGASFLHTGVIRPTGTQIMKGILCLKTNGPDPENREREGIS